MKRTKAEIMEGVECTESKIIDNNTVKYVRPDGVTVIRLHRTDILTFPKRGGVIFNTDGWKTKVTKERMNDYQHEAQIIQDKGLWYISTTGWENKKEWISYFDGVKVKDGKVINPRKTANNKDKKLLKLITGYCKEIRNMEELPYPSSGDCWYCSMRTEDGESMGDSFKDKDHLLGHLKEKYVHGSLIFNALEWAGYANPAIIFQMKLKDSCISAVRRYFKSKLGLAC